MNKFCIHLRLMYKNLKFIHSFVFTVIIYKSIFDSKAKKIAAVSKLALLARFTSRRYYDDDEQLFHKSLV